MWRKLRALITFLLAYASVIFFSYDIPCRFLNRSEARMPHVLMRLHRLSLVRLLLHLCHHLELTIHPWWLSYQCLQVLQSWAATQVRIQKGLSAQGPTGPEMKLAYCWRFGVPFMIPWNLLRPLKKRVCGVKFKKKFKTSAAIWGCHQTKTWINSRKEKKNLEYEYRCVRTKMASTGEEGAKKLQSNCAFYEELDDILGTRDAINPDRMTISSSRSFQRRSLPQQDQSWRRGKTHHQPRVLILSSLAQLRPQMNHHWSHSKSQIFF